MKIAYFLDIPIGLGGAGNVLLKQAGIMSEIHDVIVVIPSLKDGSPNPEYERRCRQSRLRYRGMYYNTAFYPQYIDLIAAKEALPEIKAFILQEKIELLHSVQLNPAVELASRELGVPHLMNAYSLRKEEFRVGERDFFPSYHSCDSFLYCSRWSAEAKMESRCIRPSAPLEEIRKKKREKQALRILMLGDLCEYKNQLTAIQAVEKCRLRGKEVFLTIAGNDAFGYAQICKDYTTQKGLTEIVTILSFQSRIEPLFEGHNCFLCTSTRESFPSSIVEAMTYDLTILSTPVAGVPELLVNRENAYISSGFDAQAVFEMIAECMEAYENGEIEKIHQCAEKTWKEHFCQAVVRQKLNEYYSCIFKNRPIKKGLQRKESALIEEATDVYEKLRQNGMEEKYVLQRCYYYACLRRSLRSGKAYIWGAGNYGMIAKRLLELLFDQIELIAFIDRKKKDSYLDFPVLSPEEIRINIDYLFLGFAGVKDPLVDDLEKIGLKYNENIWILP